MFNLILAYFTLSHARAFFFFFFFFFTANQDLDRFYHRLKIGLSDLFFSNTTKK